MSIKAEELSGNVFERIGKQWMLIGAKKDDKVNAMTASWGGLGIMWGKPVAYVFIRQSRYTKEFIDNVNTFSLSFFSDEYKKMLGYMGCTSGRDEDKIAVSGLTTKEQDNAPIFEEAETTMICKKLYVSKMEPECFVGNEEIEKWYADKDYHTMYVAEITDIIEN